MKTVTVMFSRSYDVELEVEDNYDPEEVEQIARDKVIETPHLYGGQLDFNCIEDGEDTVDYILQPGD